MRIHLMLFTLILPFIASMTASFASALDLPTLNEKFARSVEKCQVSAPNKYVFFFKQWHLAPGIDTTTDPKRSIDAPQHDNQVAIYSQLDQWIAAKSLSVLFAEGCPAPQQVTLQTPDKCNGWTVEELSTKAGTPTYPDLLSNQAYKLEAKWKSGVHVFCGDDSDAIHEGLLAFSDARGQLGYLTRLSEFRDNPVRAKIYLDGVVELYHLPEKTTVNQAIFRLGLELKESVKRIEHSIEVRNRKLVERIAQAQEDSPVVAVVFGGSHASGVKKLLEQRGIGCAIVEPTGYRNDEARLLEELKKLLR